MNARVLALVPCTALALLLAYKAKDGQVVFVLLGEAVTIEAAGGGDKKN